MTAMTCSEKSSLLCLSVLLILLLQIFGLPCVAGYSKLSRIAAKIGPRESSKLYGIFSSKTPTKSAKNGVNPGQVARQYFQYWNERNMDKAIDLFSDDCVYEDTLYPVVFTGKDSLKRHLQNVAESLPEVFVFVIDNLTEDASTGSVYLKWHVESEKGPLPFSRGLSLYKINSMGLIEEGFDIPEPTLKAGGASLSLLKLAKGFITEPIRVLPFAAWVFYCWFLFVSDIAPGVNAFQLDPATWQQVQSLSLNFWLVLPILFPATAPVNHPVMEGLFNLVLVWSGLFACFVTDGKRQKGNTMLGTLVGMQFLTNAFYLPYLFNRDTSFVSEKALRTNDLSVPEQIGEGKGLPIVFSIVGVFSITWALVGRSDFGPFSDRFSTFCDLAAHDRLTFAFVIDALYYSIFQGWLVEDDRKKRGLSDSSLLVLVAKFLPFFGLLVYSTLRPSLQTCCKRDQIE